MAGFGIGVSLIEPGPVLTEFGATAVGTMVDEEPTVGGPYDDFRRRLGQAYSHAYDGRRGRLASSPAGIVLDRAFDALLRSQWPTP